MDNEEKKKPVLRTMCRGCCFAVYGEDSYQQVDCAVGRLAQWVEKGVQVDEEEDGTYAINKYCNKARHPKWMQHYQENWVEQLDEEIFPKIDIIVPVMQGDTLEDVRRTLVSLHCEKLNSLTVAIKNDAVKATDIVQMCEDIQPIRYKVVSHVVRNQDIGDTINQTVEKLEGSFYSVLRPGQIWHTKTAWELNKYINDELNSVVLIHADDKYPTLIYRLAHVQIGGNTPEASITELIEQRVKEDGQEYLIGRWSEICNHT